MQRTTIRAVEAGTFEELCLDQMGVNYIPQLGDKVPFAGGFATVSQRTIHHTDGGHRSVLLKVKRDWGHRSMWRLLISHLLQTPDPA